jgi:hypothetical protein
MAELNFLASFIPLRVRHGYGRQPMDVVVRGGKQLRFSKIRRIFPVQTGFLRSRPKLGQLESGTESV